MKISQRDLTIALIVVAVLVIIAVSVFIGSHSSKTNVASDSTATSTSQAVSNSNTTTAKGTTHTGTKSVSSSVPASDLGWRTYTNLTYGVSFNYPSNAGIFENVVTTPDNNVRQNGFNVRVAIPGNKEFTVHVGLKDTCGYESITSQIQIGGRDYYVSSLPSTKIYLASSDKLCYVMQEHAVGSTDLSIPDKIMSSIQLTNNLSYLPAIFR